jgi:hypothetical protein
MPDISLRVVISLVRPPLSTKPVLSIVRVVVPVASGRGSVTLVVVVCAGRFASRPAQAPPASATATAASAQSKRRRGTVATMAPAVLVLHRACRPRHTARRGSELDR